MANYGLIIRVGSVDIAQVNFPLRVEGPSIAMYLAACAFMSPCFHTHIPFCCSTWLLCTPIWPPSTCIFPLKRSTWARVFVLFCHFTQACICTSFWLGIVMGNPGVSQGYPYPHLPKTHTHAGGMGICR